MLCGENVDLTPSSIFFLKLEFVELDMFSKEFCEVNEVELFSVKWKTHSNFSVNTTTLGQSQQYSTGHW